MILTQTDQMPKLILSSAHQLTTLCVLYGRPYGYTVCFCRKFEVINDWLCYQIKDGKTSNVAIFNCSAPTEAVDNDSFINFLEKLYNVISRNYIRILVGEQNAQIDGEHALWNIVGKESMHGAEVITN